MSLRIASLTSRLGRLLTGSLLLSGAATLACSSSSTTLAGGCQALEQKACTCDDGSSGVQTCDAEGKRFSACDCSGGSGGTGGSSNGGSGGSVNGGSGGSSAGNGGSSGSGAAGSGGTSAGGSGGSTGGNGGTATGGSAGSSSGGSGGAGISCPPGMAAIANSYCMDRYELKAQLPTAPTAIANETPLTNYKPKTLRSNCKNAGKRLCTLQELAYACSNGDTTLYPYGSSYTEAACGDTGLHSTGTLSSCVSADQVYDLVGNVWELTEFGTDTYATLFGGDHRRDGSPTFSCCISTSPTDAYPTGCDALRDPTDSVAFGANTTSVEVDALTHTKDAYDRDIDLGYRCCADPL